MSGGWLVSLEKRLKRQEGIELSVAFVSSDNADPDHFSYDGVDYHAIRPFKSHSYARFRIARRFMSQKAINQEVGRRIEEIIDAVQPEIIHIHGTENPLGLAARTAKERNIPVIFSIQGIAGAIVQKFYAGLPENLVSRYESLKSRILKKSAVQAYNNFKKKATMEEEFLKNASFVIGRTDWDRRVSGLFNPERQYFHVDEIMRESFYQHQWTSSGHHWDLISQQSEDSLPQQNLLDRPRLVSVFSYGVYKGFESLLQTAKLLKELYSNKFEWTIVGYCANDDCVRLAEKATRISSSEVNLRFEGKKNADEMVEIMLNADVFCHFSHIENSPNAVCEAMLLGMPVIATFAGGTSSIVQDGHDGLLVQEGEPYSAAGAIVELAHNKELALRLGSQARKSALERHNADRICKDVLKVYDLALSKHK